MPVQVNVNKPLRIAITGHRPQSFFGYNLRTPEWYALGNVMRNFCIDALNAGNTALECLTGMALGVDQVFGLVTLKLRDGGFPVKVISVIPYKSQPRLWRDRKEYDYILERADSVICLSENYSSTCLRERNIYLLKNCDVLLAAYLGIQGGTGHCIHHAEKMSIPIFHIVKQPHIHNEKIVLDTTPHPFQEMQNQIAQKV